MARSSSGSKRSATTSIDGEREEAAGGDRTRAAQIQRSSVRGEAAIAEVGPMAITGEVLEK